MKKLTAFILSVLLLLSLTACAKKAEFSFGHIDGDTYESALLGIGCKLEGWSVNTASQMLSMNGLSDGYSDQDLAALLESSALLYDMYAAASDGMQSVNVNIDNLALTGNEKITEREYLEKQIDSLKSSLESIGFTDVETEITDKTIAGETHAAVILTGKLSDTGSGYYVTGVVIKRGDYMGNIAISCLGEDRTEEILGQFYKLEKQRGE